MNTTEHTAKPNSSSTGLFATLRTLTGAKGTGARSRSLLLAPLVALTALLCLFAFSAPALAATPETPETGVAEPTATTAVLHGTLNPKAPGQPGSYQFSYLPSGTECAPGTLAPSFPTFANGLEKEAAETTVTGLEPRTEYAFCLIAYSILGATEPSEPSPAETFKTPAAAPSVAAESTSAVTSTAATLEAQVNPNNESTTYSFEYSTEQSGGVLQGSIVTVPAAPGGPLEGFGDQTASAPTETLLPDTTYFYRVIAENEQSKTEGTPATGPVQSFTTVATPTTEATTGVTSTTATFHGTLNPLTETSGAEAEYHFDYNQGSEDCTGSGETPVTPAGSGTGPQAVQATASGLQPGASYSVCLVSQNPFGSEVDPAAPQQHFTTLPGPPSIEAQSASQITPEGATLQTTVNPNNQQSTCSFEYSSVEATVEAHKGSTVSCSHPLGGGGAPVTGSAQITGLSLKTTYYFRAIAENAAHERTEDPTIEHFETEEAEKPALQSEAATNISETSATLTAKVNPNGAQITACTFQYGTDPTYGQSAPCEHPDAQEVGAGREAIAVSAAIAGSFTSTYHWRLVVTSAAGTTTSIDHTFVDSTVSGSSGNCPDEAVRQLDHSTALPDCRSYEMVTPPQKNGALINSLFANDSNWGPLIAANGADIMAPSVQCFANTESCTGERAVEGEPYEFARTPHGWVTHALAPPATEFGATTQWGANADTHSTLFSVASAPETPDDFYLRQGQDPPVKIGPVSEGVEKIDGTGRAIEALTGQGVALPVEATSDLSHILFAGAKLWSLDGPEDGVSLYEYAGQGGSKPLAVGVSGSFESTKLVSACTTHLGGEFQTSRDSYGSLSRDGRTVYFTAEGHGSLCSESKEAPASDELWARIDGEDPDAHSLLISTPTATSCESAPCKAAQSEPGDAKFEGASGDGARVFFTSDQQLTDDASQGDANLYESVCAEPCGSLSEEPAAAERELIDVSAGAQNTGGARVQGVMAISSDGSHVYFVARGKLTSSDGVLPGSEAQEDQENLYVYAAGQPLRFIATLPHADAGLFEHEKRPEWDGGIGFANVNPDGRFLVFESHAALTADDTRPDNEGGPTPPAQIYRYDDETDAIVRISKGQSGFNDNGNAGSTEAESEIVPASKGWEYAIGTGRADPTMSDDGEYVFFESPVALAPGALNEVKAGEPPVRVYAENVYEYHDGTVSLISDGKDVTPNSSSTGIDTSTRLVGTDTTGRNVFFAANDQVTPQDTDTQRDYYDARICEEFEPCVAPPPAPAPGCSEEGCRGQAPGTPAASTPGSESFTGPGNLAAPPPAATVKPKPLTRAQKLAKALKACRTKHNKAKRAKCEKAARKAFGAHKASKTSKRRR